MEKIIQIFMKRDELTRKEAIDQYNEMKEFVDIAVAQGDFDGAEQTLLDYGLEMDYFMDIYMEVA